MTNNQSPSGPIAPISMWDEQVDLRRWLGALLHGKFIILTFLLTALALAAIIDFIFIPPSYVSSGRVALPNVSLDDSLGMTLLDYREFAASDSTMERLKQELGSPLSRQQLRDGLQFELNQGDRFLEITASANTPETTLLVAKTWMEIFREGLRSELGDNLAQQQIQAARQAELFNLKLLKAQDRLQQFNVETPITTTESQIISLKQYLASSETKLIQLARSTIPDLESQLANLQEDLAGSSNGFSSTSSNTPSSDYLLHEQNFRQGQLAALEVELLNSQNRLRRLRLFDIPTAQAKIAYLEEVLASTPITLGPLAVDSYLDAVAGSSTKTLVLNPSHLQISQELVTAQTEFATNQGEAAALVEGLVAVEQETNTLRRRLVSDQAQAVQRERERSIAQQIAASQFRLNEHHKDADSLEASLLGLKESLAELEPEYVTARATQRQLTTQANTAAINYESANKELADLRDLEAQLPTLATATITQEPALPTPLATQRTRNMVISGFLGLFLGCALVLFLALYRGLPVAPGTGRSQAEAVAAGAETSQ